MKAIAIVPGTPGSRIVDRPEPSITAPDEVKVKVIRVGICGTDRTEVSGGRADAPDSQKELVIGHEMFGQVVGTGSSVTRVKTRDFVVFTVRRGCRAMPSLLDGPSRYVPDRQLPGERHPWIGWLSNGIRS